MTSVGRFLPAEMTGTQGDASMENRNNCPEGASTFPPVLINLLVATDFTRDLCNGVLTGRINKTFPLK